MTKLFKHLKPFILSIILVFALLIIQAMCDLALPGYTSDVVNVGIQAGGVETSIPEVIRPEQLDNLKLFMSDEDVASLDECYKLYSADNIDELDARDDVVNAVKKAPLYILDESKLSDDGFKESLNLSLQKAEMSVSTFDGSTDTSKEAQQQIRSKLPPEMQNSDMTLFEIFKAMPKEQISALTEEMNKQFSAIPDSILEQSSHSFVKSEYEKAGLDTDAIQNNYIFTAGAKMLAIAFVSLIVSVGVGYLASIIAASLGRNLRHDVFTKVVSFSNAEFDKFSTASLITRSTNDIQQIQMLMVMLLRIVFYAPIMGIGGIIKVLGTNTSMTWIIAVGVVALLSLVIVLFAFAMPKFTLMQKLIDKLNLVMREILTGIPVLRAFGTERYEENRFDNANAELTKTNLFVNRVMTCMMPAMMLLMNGITLLIMWFGGKSINDGGMQVGDLMAFIQYTMQIIMSFLMISMVSIMLPRASVSMKRIDEVLVSEVTVKDALTSKTAVADKKGVVEFCDVSFSYPNADENVLSHISFTANPGETTAFIGSTGSGKSTLINLIPRFYDVTQGSILVSGVDVRDITEHDLREKIGYVPQKGVLFSGTIETNLKYAGEHISDERMELAATVAQAADFIGEKELGYKDEITQGGSNVSGGQKQRLSIARAIAKQPEVYIFDDSFSALDYRTDITLRNALKKHTSNSTVLIVAQRISTIIHAEQIIVLDEGEIIGKGTHKELLKSCEVYNQIASSQLSKEELEHE